MFDHQTTDQLESQLRFDEEVINRLRSRQIEVLEELDRRQVASGDACRSLSEWVAWKLDTGSDTARGLVRTMRRTAQRPDLRDELAGGTSFDRIEALSRIPDNLGLWTGMDVGQVRREAARRAGSTGDDFKTGDDRFLVIQPSIDEAWWKLWGGLDGPSGALLDKVLSEAADNFPEMPDGSQPDRAWSKATALVELCVSDTPTPAQVTVFVDASLAAGSDGETGVVLEAGPAVARQALEAILCDSVQEVTARTEDGRYMEYGRRRRTVTPALHRALMDRYLGACAANGCESRNRLQAHHVIPWSRGGPTDQENLVLLCWFHHQTVVHERGFEPVFHPDHGRVRFRKARDPVLARRP